MEGKLGKLRVEAQSTTSRIASKTAAQEPTTTIDKADLTKVAGELADARDFNATWDKDPYDFGNGLAGLLHDPREYTELRDKPVYGLLGDWDPNRAGINNVRSQLDSGWSQDVSDGVITWGFFEFKHAYGVNLSPKAGDGKGYFPFTDAQKAAAYQSIVMWDDLIAATFVEITPDYKRGAGEWARNDVDIWMANTASSGAQAWAYYPGQPNSGQRVSGDVWIGASADNFTDLFPGGYGLNTQVHELGHAIGLSHAGEYDAGDDNDGDGVADPITYVGDAFYWQDSRQYTIMSYFDVYETGSNMVDYNTMRVVYGSTPMVHDIWVAQQKYGADHTTRAGDTTYGFNWSSDVTNASMQFEAGARHTIFSIWDGAGNDTLDLSGYYTPSIIDLREGAYSSAGGLGAYDAAWVGVDPSTLTPEAYLAFVNANNAALGLAARTAAYDLYFGGRPGANEGVAWSDFNGRDWVMENNIGIAYGATIENAIGGGGNDRINGNQATNSFRGNGGADTFIIADYSGTTLDGQTFDDESVDTILDFDSGVDKIDLSELGVTWTDLSFAGNTWTVERGADDLSFIVLGETAVQSDFIFG
jgi:serralysin